MWQGVSHECPAGDNWASLDACIKKWRKTRDNEYFTIEVPKDRVNIVRASLEALGIKI
jgi:hypothetical protein